MFQNIPALPKSYWEANFICVLWTVISRPRFSPLSGRGESQAKPIRAQFARILTNHHPGNCPKTCTHPYISVYSQDMGNTYPARVLQKLALQMIL